MSYEQRWKKRIKDRAILEKGTIAFTSHVRAYLEHRLPYIFRWEKLTPVSESASVSDLQSCVDGAPRRLDAVFMITCAPRDDTVTPMASS